MPNLSTAEAADLLDRSITEAQRLGMHFSQRSKDEKKRMSTLQQLVPKLKRLARSQALDKPLSADEHKMLESLKTPPEGAAAAGEKATAAKAPAKAAAAPKAEAPAKKAAAKAAPAKAEKAPAAAKKKK